MYMYIHTYVYFIVQYLIFGSSSQIVEKHTKCARYCGPYKGKEVRELPSSLAAARVVLLGMLRVWCLPSTGWQSNRRFCFIVKQLFWACSLNRN